MKIHGEGIANKSKSGQILDVYFPNIEFDNQKTEFKTIEITSNAQEIMMLDWSKKDLDEPIKNAADAYFKLHLIL